MKKIVLALGAIYVVINETTIFQFDLEGSENPQKIIVRKSGVLPGGEVITKEQLAERLEGKKLLLEGISQEEIESFLEVSEIKAEYFLGEPAPIEDQPAGNADGKPVDELHLGNADGENENTVKSELTEDPTANAEDTFETGTTKAATTGGSLEDESGQNTSQDGGPDSQKSNTIEENAEQNNSPGDTNS